MTHRILTRPEVLQRLRRSSAWLSARQKDDSFPIRPHPELGRGRYLASVIEDYLDRLSGKDVKSSSEQIADDIARRLERMKHGKHQNVLSAH